MPRSGAVGEKVYSRVQELTEKGQSRTEAFAAVAEETGSRPGSVAANYYRVARKQNGKPPKEPVAQKEARPATPKRTTASDQLATCIEQMVNEAVDARFKRLLG